MTKIITCVLFAFTLTLVNPIWAQDQQQRLQQLEKEVLLLKHKSDSAELAYKNAKEKSTNVPQEKVEEAKREVSRTQDDYSKHYKQYKAKDQELRELKNQLGISQNAQPQNNNEETPQVEEIDNVPDEVPAIPKEEVDTVDATINASSSDSTSTPGSWWKYLLAMLGISGLCSGAVFYILNKKIEDLKSMLKADNQATQRVLNQRLDNLAVKTDRIETSVGSVRQDIKNRDRIVANEAQRTAPSYGPTTVQPSQPKRPTEFYLSMPSTDGSWNDVSTVNKPGQCLYVLNSPDGINGTFRVINEPVAVQSILMAVGKYLSPVCRVTNTATQVSGIVTDEPGVAVFENGIWRMTKKAVVHYV